MGVCCSKKTSVNKQEQVGRKKEIEATVITNLTVEQFYALKMHIQDKFKNAFLILEDNDYCGYLALK